MLVTAERARASRYPGLKCTAAGGIQRRHVRRDTQLAARALHYGSLRWNKPFVVENCGALPDELLESELFGHKRGAFTGAVEDHMGLFERANGGSVFLDEIGEVSPAFQVKLLRVLREGEIRPVGGTDSWHCTPPAVARAPRCTAFCSCRRSASASASASGLTTTGAGAEVTD